MAVTTNNAQINLALIIEQQAQNAYFAIGRSSAWDTESQPPAELPSTTSVDTPIGYRRADKVLLCRPATDAEVASKQSFSFGKDNYMTVADKDAYAQDAHYIYLETTISADDFPKGSYRQVGLYFGLKSLIPAKINLLPNEVDDPGILWTYENDQATTRSDSRNITMGFILTTLPLVQTT